MRSSLCVLRGKEADAVEGASNLLAALTAQAKEDRSVFRTDNLGQHLPHDLRFRGC